MKYVIEPLYLGRYNFRVFNDNGEQVSCADGGSAFIMVMLTRLIFEREHSQYILDQRTNSDAIGASLIEDMKSNPEKYLPPKQIEGK